MNSTTNEKSVSIIIVNWNGKDVLIDCIESIRKNTTLKDYEIIVVDNGSTDGSQQALKKRYPEAILIENKRNVGFAIAVNQGIRKARGKYIMLLNNDTRVRPMWLERLVNCIGKSENIGAVGALLADFRYPNQPYGLYSLKSYGNCACLSLCPNWFKKYFLWEKKSVENNLVEVDLLQAAAVLIKRITLEKVGLFDEIFSPFYGEDFDWCMRARLAGFRLLVCTDVIIDHIGGYSANKLKKEVTKFHSFKNRIRFVLINFPWIWHALLIPTYLKEVVKEKETRKYLVRAWLFNIKHVGETLKKHKERMRRKRMKRFVRAGKNDIGCMCLQQCRSAQ